jgi:hypothetical protein
MSPIPELFLVSNTAGVAFALAHVALLILMAFSAVPSHIEYSTVTGYFMQDEPATNPVEFNFVGYLYLSCSPLPRPENRGESLTGEGNDLLISP